MELLSFAGWLLATILTGLLWRYQLRTQSLARSNSELAILANIVRQTSNSVIITDVERRIAWVNEAFTASTGYSFDEVMGRKPAELLQCDKTSKAAIESMRRAFEAQQGFHGELLNRCKDGREYWIHIDVEPIFDAHQRLTGFSSIQRDVTDRKQLEYELEKSRSLFSGALDASSVDIAILDAEGKILFANEAWRKLSHSADYRGVNFGIGENYFEITNAVSSPDCEISQHSSAGIRAVIDGQRESYQLEYASDAGLEPRWYLLNVARFRCPGPVRLVVSHEDITARKLAEQRLMNKQEKLRSVYNACSDGILLFNTQGLFDCNNSAVKIFGASKSDELLGKHLWDFAIAHQPDGRSTVGVINEHLLSNLQQGDTRFELMLSHVDGSTFPAEILLTTFQHNNERVVQATVRDNTERKQVEQRLQMMNQQLQEDLNARTYAEKKIRETTAYLDVYRKIVDNHAIVAETDTKGTIIAVNDAFCRISGYTRDELIGKNHRILNSGHHPREMWSDMYKSVAKGGFWHGEICNRSKNGALYWVDTTIAPLFDEAGKLRGYFAIRADITSLKKAQTQAESANRSKSEFLANMSHEIRTPMTAILGYTDILAEIESCAHCQSSQQSATAVETIKRNGEHLLAIINDILDISKIEADKMTVESMATELPGLLNDVVHTMQVKAQAKGLSLDCCLTTPVPKIITTDPTRLRQILVNLIGNAIKFTEFGSVKVSVRADLTRPTMLFVDVIDTGIGMTTEQTGRLFQAFEQADTSMTRRFGGTGLGLRISKRLAQMLGGDITVACSVGKGCTFTVCINVGQTEAHNWTSSLSSDSSSEAKAQVMTQSADARSTSTTRITPTGVQGKATPLDGIRVLLVEDGPDNQRLITHHLRKAGAVVQLAGNGKLGVEALTADGSLDAPLADPLPFDIVLMDMQMPVMDGYEATSLLRGKGARIPILALTAHAMAGDLQRCLDVGCDLRLTKPIDRHALIESCQVEHQRYVSVLPATALSTTNLTVIQASMIENG